MKTKSLAQYRNELKKFTERENYLVNHIADMHAGKIEGNPKTIEKHIKDETAELYRVRAKIKSIKKDMNSGELIGC